MQQRRVTTAEWVTQPKEEVVAGCFFFERKKKEKKSFASSWTTRNDFLMVKKMLLFLQEKMIKYIAYRLNQYLKKNHALLDFPCTFVHEQKGMLFAQSRYVMFFLPVNENKWTVCWSNCIFSWNAGKISPTKLKSFLSLSHLKLSNCKVVVISRQKVVLSFENARLPHF